VRQRPASVAPPAAARPASPAPKPAPAAAAPRPERKRRLTFKESGELAALPGRIDAAEQEREGLYAALADPATARDGAAMAAATARLAALDAELAALLARWEELETIAAEAATA
jgi:ATP-binding cassette subfamily F protein uup